MTNNLMMLAATLMAVVGTGAFFAVIAYGSSNFFVGVGNLLVRRNLERNQREATDLFISANPVHLFWGNVGATIAVVGLAHWFFGSMVVSATVAVFMMLFPGFYWARERSRRFKKIEEQLPDAFMMLASSLQSGASIASALQTVAKESPAPFSQEMNLVVRKTQVGVSLDDALVQMEQRVPIDSLIMATSAVRISREVGGNLVDTIFGIAETLRRKFTMEGKIESLTAQGKAQGKFMAALPILVGGGLSLIDPESMGKLLSTAEGNLVMMIIVVMQVLGFIFINKVTSIDS